MLAEARNVAASGQRGALGGSPFWLKQASGSNARSAPFAIVQVGASEAIPKTVQILWPDSLVGPVGIRGVAPLPHPYRVYTPFPAKPGFAAFRKRDPSLRTFVARRGRSLRNPLIFEKGRKINGLHGTDLLANLLI